VKKTIGLSLFSSSYSLSFSFNQGSEGPDDVGVIIAKKKEDDKKNLETVRAILGREVKVYKGIASGVLKSEIKGNETRKDYNALIDPTIVIASVRSVFGYQ
jgi:hypothetical protein